jgi:hypothetical protein
MTSEQHNNESFGELDFANGKSNQAFLRWQFLSSLKANAPQVMEQLCRSLLPIFRQAKELEGLPWRDVAIGKSKPMKAARRAVQQWSESWNLNAEWCREELYNEAMIAYLRTSHPNIKPTPFNETILDLAFASDRHNLSIASPPDGLRNYLPIAETRKEYLNQVKAKALQPFDDGPLTLAKPSLRRATVDSVIRTAEAYCKSVEAAYLKQNHTHSKKRRELDRHLKWTVKFQVLRKTLPEIAEAHVGAKVIADSAISKAVTDLLRSVELNKRPDAKPGRIKNSKNRRYTK